MAAYSCSRPVQEVSNAEEVDAILKSLQDACGTWHAMPRQRKIALLQQVRGRAIKASVDLGKATAKIAGFSGGENEASAKAHSAANMMALFVGTNIAKAATSYIQQLQTLQKDGKMETLQVARKTADGRSVVDMGACSEADPGNKLTAGGHAWHYTQTIKQLTQGQESAAALAAPGAGPAVVLGAGNQAFLAAEDTLHMLFDKGLPVLLKHHPAQAEAAQMWEYVFEPLATAGVYRGILADLPLTQAALYSQRTAAVHLTGAVKTYEDILWGPGEKGAARKAASEPLLKVPFTAELGNVTPVLVTPGPWTAAEMASAAKTITFGTSNNAGCNCLAPKVVVMAAEWPQADEFEGVLKDAFRTSPSVPCWYPGSDKRYQAFVGAHPPCDLVPGTKSEGATYSAEVLPWAFHSVTLASLADADAIPGLQEEFFAPVVILLRIPTATGGAAAPVATTAHASPEPTTTAASEEGSAPKLSEADRKAAEGFLKCMPDFLEQHVHGNLCCSIYLPDVVKTAMPEAAQNCVDNLRYGAVVVNYLPIVAYNNQVCWGGHMTPQSSQRNVGSGIGKLHNGKQIDELEKSLMVFPWGHCLDMPDAGSLPGYLVPVLAGLIGGGLRGVWAALTPW